jgi:hypothetical protein
MSPLANHCGRPNAVAPPRDFTSPPIRPETKGFCTAIRTCPCIQGGPDSDATTLRAPTPPDRRGTDSVMFRGASARALAAQAAAGSASEAGAAEVGACSGATPFSSARSTRGLGDARVELDAGSQSPLVSTHVRNPKSGAMLVAATHCLHAVQPCAEPGADKLSDRRQRSLTAGTGQTPVAPSIRSRMRSAWPSWRAYSAIMWV